MLNTTLHIFLHAHDTFHEDDKIFEHSQVLTSQYDLSSNSLAYHSNLSHIYSSLSRFAVSKYLQGTYKYHFFSHS